MYPRSSKLAHKLLKFCENNTTEEKEYRFSQFKDSNKFSVFKIEIILRETLVEASVREVRFSLVDSLVKIERNLEKLL